MAKLLSHNRREGLWLDDASSEQRRRQKPANSGAGSSVSSMAKSLLPIRRRLRLDPSTKLYFPYEPGKQVKSAIKIKNISKSHTAFKFQTTAPKSCFMRPPSCVLSPGETIVATVFKFIEHPDGDTKDLKSNVKFKILSMKVQDPVDFAPEAFDQKDQVAVEQVLKVVFLDPERPSTQMEKLNRLLAEADAAMEARKKSPEVAAPGFVGEGIIDEWKERRERYLAQQQVGIDSV